MKKLHLLAFAALLCSAGAHAQSSVSLYGLIDMSVGASKAPGGATIYNANSGNMSTSYIGFSGSEDLGAGLSAIFTLDTFLRSDAGAAGRFNGDAFWARNAFVGLNSKTLGQLTLGRNTTPLFVSTLIFNAFGDSFGYSPSIRQYFTSNTVSGDSGWSNSVMYTTPGFSGVTASLIAAAGEGTGSRKSGLSALYFGGPLAATAVYQKVGKDAAAAAAETDTWQLGASYDFGMLKAFGQFGRVENLTSKVNYDLGSIGASVPVGGGKILAQYAEIKPSVGAKRKTLSAGYDYLLSKRTDLYAVAMSDKITGLSEGTSYSVGVRHRF